MLSDLEIRLVPSRPGWAEQRISGTCAFVYPGVSCKARCLITHLWIKYPRAPRRPRPQGCDEVGPRSRDIDWQIPNLRSVAKRLVCIAMLAPESLPPMKKLDKNSTANMELSLYPLPSLCHQWLCLECKTQGKPAQ